MTYNNLDLTNSNFVNVMNAARFVGSDWLFKGTFVASSNLAASALFEMNFISLTTLKIRSEECTSFTLNKVTLFKTPPYSLLLIDSL